MMTESNTQEKSNKEQDAFPYITVFGLYAKKSGRGNSKGAETLLSVYKSSKDAGFIKDLLISGEKHTFPHFNLSEKDELSIKEIPSSVSFGETLPSDEETVSELEQELDKILESLESQTED